MEYTKEETSRHSVMKTIFRIWKNILLFLMIVFLLSVMLLTAIFFKNLVTISSIKKVSDAPAYQMTYHGGYALDDYLKQGSANSDELRTFLEDIAIGWCNAADMDSYLAFVPDFTRQNKCGKTFSVVCFEIAPGYRGKGIALAFLERICNDAKEGGYAAVEGYPLLRDDGFDYSFVGTISLYKKAGFTEVDRQEEQVVMRKTL